MESIFKDESLQRQFDKQGYVVLKQFALAELNRLREICSDSDRNFTEGFSTSIHNKDIDEKKRISSAIERVLNSAVQTQFEKFRQLGASILNKTSGQNSYMPPHQDWTITDESKYYSATIWIPLVDTNEGNGTLRVLPKSHRYSKLLRGPSIPCALQDIRESIFSKTQTINFQAGDAVIFNHALIHASSPNLSGNNRPVVTYGLIPQNAELLFYHQNNLGLLEEYKIADDFFLTYNHIGQAPEQLTPTRALSQLFIPYTQSTFNNIATATKNMHMKRLFKDDSVQDFFNKNGYVKIPMLGQEEVAALLRYYYEENLRDISGSGFSMSMEDEDKEKVRRVREKIFDVALPKALPHLHNGKVIAGSYVVKHPNPTGVVPPHQDWSFVDNEGEYYSVTCWIPLVDTTIENGCMGVIPGSHNLIGNLRPSPSPQVPTPLSNHVFSIMPFFKMYEMKAGEALIFDHRTFHGSTPNITDSLRVAIGLGFTQGDAVICHYNLKANGKKDTIQKYYVDDNFLMKYNNLRLSQMYDRGETVEGYQIAEEFAYDCPNFSLEELKTMFEENGNVYDANLVAALSKLFPAQQQQEQQAEEKYSYANTEEALPTNVSQPPVVNSKPFWKVYTPVNIIKEIAYRLGSN